MNYNPYFPGGAIAMARVLFDGLVEYDDGESCFGFLIPQSSHTLRNTCNYFTNGKGCRHILELGLRARTRREEETWVESCHSVLGADCDQHLCQAIQMDGHQEQENSYVPAEFVLTGSNIDCFLSLQPTGDQRSLKLLAFAVCI
jgi:hypothetical protein